MSRSEGVRSRAGRRWFLAATLVAGLATPVLAQTPTAQPVVNSAPQRVGFKKAAVVRATLENGAPGQEVAIQRKTTSGWRTLQSRPVDEDNRVRFRLGSRRISLTYRLRHVDEIGEVESTSRSFRIRVRPKLTLRKSPRYPFAGRRVTVKGQLRPARNGRRVIVERRVNGSWRRIGRVAVRDGRYRTSFKANNPGRSRLRVRFPGDGANLGARKGRRLKVYDPALATWYGPGFWGNRTACGRTLRRDTVGVAHRSLPCGTMVEVVYRGKAITVPVIDRGPYTSARWDLTQRAAERINFSGRNTVGTVRR